MASCSCTTGVSLWPPVTQMIRLIRLLFSNYVLRTICHITSLDRAGQRLPHPCYSAKRRCSCCPSQPQSSPVGYPVVFPSLMDYVVLYLSSLKNTHTHKKGDGQKLFCLDALSIRSSSPHYDRAEAPLPGPSLAPQVDPTHLERMQQQPQSRGSSFELRAGQYIFHYDFPACDFYPGVYQLIPSHTFHLQQESHYLKPIKIIPFQHRENGFILWWVIWI